MQAIIAEFTVNHYFKFLPLALTGKNLGDKKLKLYLT